MRRVSREFVHRVLHRGWPSDARIEVELIVGLRPRMRRGIAACRVSSPAGTSSARSKSATSRRASANAPTAAGSSRSRSSTISASSAGRTRQPWRKTRSPPIQAPTRIASCATARSFSRRRRVGTAAASASSAVVLMMPVDRGRPSDRMIRGHGQPVDPADDAGRQRGRRGAGRDDVTEPDPL